jgi:histidinol-phosphatase
VNKGNASNDGPQFWGPEHEGRLVAMIEVAQAAGKHTLNYFRRADLIIDAKADESPVTVADREAEQLVRRDIGTRFPNDTIQGEEFSEQSGTSPYRWVVDPIDGTKSFVCGVPLYSTLLALEHEGEPLAGIIFVPAMNEMVAACLGRGCWHRQSDAAEWRRTAVSGKADLSEAVFVTSQVDSFDARDAADKYKKLEKAAWLTRSWGDGYGYLMVATGKADVMVDPECNAWDVAAILPIVSEAGGKFSDWAGNATTRGGDGVGTNGKLHGLVLSALSSDQ